MAKVSIKEQLRLVKVEHKKQCNYCLRIKDLSEFYKTNAKKTGFKKLPSVRYSTDCKDCTRIIRYESYLRKKELQ